MQLRWIKKICSYILIYVLLAVVLLPLLVTFIMGGFSAETIAQVQSLYGLDEYLQAIPQETTDKPFPQNELEEYVVGVVAAEMPALFPTEALKAQAVAARTYQVRKMQENHSTHVLYDVGQAYADTDAQKKKWGADYEKYAAIVRDAVAQTAGEIMVYDGEPILAAFHAQSCGKTEDSEHVWTQALPYLRSVESSGDATAPDHTALVTYSDTEVWEKLSAYGNLGFPADKLTFSHIIRSDAGYVLRVTVGKKTFSGQEIRSALGLRSTDFTVTKHGNTFTFTTKGYGHGAGMSQYGAKAFADAGYDYHQILSHYYTDILFEINE